MTNLEAIKQMNKEQLAQFIYDLEQGYIDYRFGFCNLCQHTYDCVGCIQAWLSRNSKEKHGIEETKQ